MHAVITKCRSDMVVLTSLSEFSLKEGQIDYYDRDFYREFCLGQ